MRSYTWLFPFFCFFIGYYGAKILWNVPSIHIPSLLGLQIQEGCSTLTSMHLGVRLLDQPIHDDLPVGTIVNQSPLPGAKVKIGTPISITATRQTARTTAPDYRMKSKNAIEQDAQTKKLRIRFYPMPSTYPVGLCIGQWPDPDAILEDNKMVIYYALSEPPPVIIPDVRTLPLQAVINVCLLEGLMPPIVQTQKGTPSTNEALILDQRPLPGTIVNRKTLQWYVEI